MCHRLSGGDMLSPDPAPAGGMSARHGPPDERAPFSELAEAFCFLLSETLTSHQICVRNPDKSPTSRYTNHQINFAIHLS
jgi:hypothetical protein